MKLYMKQKVFSWGDKFTIKDEDGNDCYYVEGEFLTIGKKLHIYDAAHNEVAFIRQKVLSFMPRYFIEINGQSIEIVKEMTILTPNLLIKNLSWKVNGDFFAHEYTLSDGNCDIMRLSKKWLKWGDTYEMDIFGQADEVLCLCITLAVDCVLEETRDILG